MAPIARTRAPICPVLCTYDLAAHAVDAGIWRRNHSRAHARGLTMWTPPTEIRYFCFQPFCSSNSVLIQPRLSFGKVSTQVGSKGPCSSVAPSPFLFCSTGRFPPVLRTDFPSSPAYPSSSLMSSISVFRSAFLLVFWFSFGRLFSDSFSMYIFQLCAVAQSMATVAAFRGVRGSASLPARATEPISHGFSHR